MASNLKSGSSVPSLPYYCIFDINYHPNIAHINMQGASVLVLIVYFAKGEPRNVEYCKVFVWKHNIWVLRTRKLPDAKFFIHSILRNWPNYMLIR